jgi:phage gp29-like protein
VPLPPNARDLLTREVSGPALASARSILSGHPANGLTPDRLAVLLRSAEDGDAEAYLELAEQMEERDLHYLSVIGTRKRQVAQLPITVEAASDSADDVARADLVREWLRRDTLETELFDILDSIGKGFSVTEIVWSTSGGRWLPAALHWRDPRWFEFSREDGTTLLLKGGHQAGQGSVREPLAPLKFVRHVTPAKSGLAIRGGFARAAAWCYLFKNYALKDWVAFAEVYGLPFRVGRYDAGASEEDIRKLMQAVSQIGTDAAAVMPRSMEVQFVDGKATGGAELWERLCDYLDRQISKAVLGQTATTDADTGGLGSGAEHGEVRADIERADAKALAATLQRDLVVPIIDLNFGAGPRYPLIRIGREESHDTAAMTAALAGLVPLGLKVGMSTVRDRLGFPDPEPGEETLAPQAGERITAPPSAASGPGGPLPRAGTGITPSALLSPSYFDLAGRPGSANPVAGVLVAAVTQILAERAGPQTVAEEAAAVLSGDWREALAPLVDPLVEAMTAATSYEEAIEALIPAIQRMDTAVLEQALARGSLLAAATARAEPDTD